MNGSIRIGWSKIFNAKPMTLDSDWSLSRSFLRSLCQSPSERLKLLRRFWDTHDLTDFEDELAEVHETVFEHRAEETVTIRLPAEEAEAVKRMAMAMGMEHAALIREWVLEKLHHA